MIAVVDMVNKGVSHEMFNAGMLLQICEAYPDSKVVYYAEEQQIDNVSRILSGRKETSCGLSFEKKILSSIDDLAWLLSRHMDISAIVFTGVLNNSYEDVLTPFAENNPDIKIWILQHGEIEGWLRKETVVIPRFYTIYPRAIASSIKRVYKQVLSLHKRESERKKMISGMRKAAKEKNIGFIVFSDEFANRLDIIDVDVFDKMKRLYLPYVNGIIEKTHKRDHVVIGALPSAVAAPDASVWRVIKYVNRKISKINTKFIFCLFRRNTQCVKNVTSWDSWDDSRENINDFLRNCDYVLVPYDEKKYVLSSSGIAHDAIYSEVPLIMGGSHCFDQFEEADIGIRGRSIKEIGDAIIDELNHYSSEKKENYTKNIKKFEKTMQYHNSKVLKSMCLDN